MGTANLVKPLGIELPMVFEKGQLLVSEAMRRMIIYPTGNTRQTVRGNILFGVTYEPNQTERITTIEGARKVANDAVSRYPALKDVQIIRHFAGIRPLPKDGKPYLGPVKRVPGLYIATSHSGITLAPVHGKVISELIQDGDTDVPIESYWPERHMPAA
jgi:sarcosine oxidase subunit beta